jgi:hypothetical protein
MKKLLLLIIIVIFLIIGAIGYALFLMPKSNNQSPSPQANATEYLNNKYGFKFSLPDSWKGYSIIEGEWNGNTVRGPEISIRNPRWTQQKPYQDIPIMIFTLQQWDDMQQDKFHIGAAPINPSMLNYSSNYVFALPARYNYAFPEGFQEVEQILQQKPLQPLQPVNFNNLPVDKQIYLCAGIPSNSTQNVTETTRLFINLPKNVYSDKEKNLQFKTVSGNAAAGWVSNGGPYGEGYQTSDNCWSYYYEFNGNGEVDLNVKSTASGKPDYFVKFIVGKK